MVPLQISVKQIAVFLQISKKYHKPFRTRKPAAFSSLSLFDPLRRRPITLWKKSISRRTLLCKKVILDLSHVSLFRHHLRDLCEAFRVSEHNATHNLIIFDHYLLVYF
jgi:hypothetical protein